MTGPMRSAAVRDAIIREDGEALFRALVTEGIEPHRAVITEAGEDLTIVFFDVDGESSVGDLWRSAGWHGANGAAVVTRKDAEAMAQVARERGEGDSARWLASRKRGRVYLAWADFAIHVVMDSTAPLGWRVDVSRWGLS